MCVRCRGSTYFKAVILWNVQALAVHDHCQIRSKLNVEVSLVEPRNEEWTPVLPALPAVPWPPSTAPSLPPGPPSPLPVSHQPEPPCLLPLVSWGKSDHCPCKVIVVNSSLSQRLHLFVYIYIWGWEGCNWHNIIRCRCSTWFSICTDHNKPS